MRYSEAKVFSPLGRLVLLYARQQSKMHGDYGIFCKNDIDTAEACTPDFGEAGY